MIISANDADSRFFSLGLAGLQVIPIFALTYLQNELSAWTSVGQSKLLNLAAMFASFSLLYTSTWPVGRPIGILITVLLTITLSMSIHYTYRDYTIDEGYYITIPYLIIYACLVFGINGSTHPFLLLRSSSASFMLACSLLCYVLFSLSTYVGLKFHSSALNYLAFLGLLVGTSNIGSCASMNPSRIFMMNFSSFQLIHVYLYLAHLLSVRFEISAAASIGRQMALAVI